MATKKAAAPKAEAEEKQPKDVTVNGEVLAGAKALAERTVMSVALEHKLGYDETRALLVQTLRMTRKAATDAVLRHTFGK